VYRSAEFPACFKFKTLRLIDELTGEPSFEKLNELVQEAVGPLLIGGVDRTSFIPARLCYFYTDQDDDRVLITTSEALKAALDGCSGKDSCKIQLTVKPTEPSLRLVRDNTGTKVRL
jgi:hypothetical protein